MKAKDWLKIFIFAVIIAALTFGASRFLRMPEARDVVGMNGYYLEEDNSLDVILIGASPSYTDFYSPLAYEQQGFTSYAVATGALCGRMYPSAIREALTTQDPQLIVFDLSAFFEEDQYNRQSLRRWLDSIHNQENRKQSLEELVPEGEKLSYRIPFLKYHSNWPNARWCLEAVLDKMDQKKRGYSVTKNFTVYTGFDQEDYGQTVCDISEGGMKALDQLLDYLKEQNLDNKILFVRLPYKGEVIDGDRYLEGVEKILAAGYDIVDCWGETKNVHVLDLELNEQDFHDKEHLTIFGAEKVTTQLAAFIAQEYGITGGHTGSVKEKWDAAASYNAQVIAHAKQMTSETEAMGIYTQKDLLK